MAELTQEQIAHAEELLNDEELKTYLGEKFIPKDEVAGLEKNRNDILDEKRALKEQLDNFKTIEESISQDGYEDLNQALEELRQIKNSTKKKAEKDNDVDRLKDIYENDLRVKDKQYKTNLDKLEEQYTSRVAELESRVNELTSGWDQEKIDNTINGEFDRIKVLPEYKSVLRDALHGRASVEVNEDGERIVSLISDDGLKQPASQYFDMWKESDKGRLFIAAPRSMGGGSPGAAGVRRPGTIAALRQEYDSATKLEDKVAATLKLDAAKRRK